MKANSLSISIPVGTKGVFTCNKNCPYCVSKMTGLNTVDCETFVKHLPKAEKMAQIANVQNIILTGKSEPTLNMPMLKEVSRYFRNYPLEIQTNGILLGKNPKKYITEFSKMGIDTVATSIDSVYQLESLIYVFSYIKSMGMTTRITVNLTDMLLKGSNILSVEEYINFCNNFGIEELSFRKVVAPFKPIDTKESKQAVKWIEDNVSTDLVEAFENQFYTFVKENGTFYRHLTFGADLYMVDDVSCVIFERCIQENNDDSERVRSLIYFEDGHMSTSWYGSNFGRVF